MRCVKPCLRLRRRMFGWKVRFMISIPTVGGCPVAPGGPPERTNLRATVRGPLAGHGPGASRRGRRPMSRKASGDTRPSPNRTLYRDRRRRRQPATSRGEPRCDTCGHDLATRFRRCLYSQRPEPDGVPSRFRRLVRWVGAQVPALGGSSAAGVAAGVEHRCCRDRYTACARIIGPGRASSDVQQWYRRRREDHRFPGVVWTTCAREGHPTRCPGHP